MPPRSKRGIFCLETERWGRVHDKTSVRPLLEFLATSETTLTPFIHRDVATLEELKYYLKHWTRRGNSNYPILYLAFHGEQGAIYLQSTGKAVHLDTIAEMLEGKCNRRLIHFGSCSTVGIHGNSLNQFLRATNALAVSGYTTDVGFMESAALEMLYFSELAGGAFTRASIRAAKRRLDSIVSSLVKTNGLAVRISRPR